MRSVRLLAALSCIALVATPARAQWGDAATPLSISTDAVDAEVLTDAELDGNYGLLIGWRNETTQQAVAQHLDPIGTPLWGATGLTLATTGLAQPNVAVCADGTRGAYVAWVDDVDAPATPQRIMVMRVRNRAAQQALPGTGVGSSLGTVVTQRRLASSIYFTAGEQALFGYRTASGTVAVATDGTVTGTGTEFIYDLSPGDYLAFDDLAAATVTGSSVVWYQVLSISSQTELTLLDPPAAAIPAGAPVHLQSNNLHIEMTVGDTITYLTDDYVLESVAPTTARVVTAPTANAAADVVVNRSRVWAGINLTGTLDFTAGSRTVTSHTAGATSFLTQVRPGDYLWVAGTTNEWCEVDRVNSDDELTLRFPFPGATNELDIGVINGSQGETQFVTDVKTGEFFSHTGAAPWVKVSRVVSNTSLSLVAPAAAGSNGGGHITSIQTIANLDYTFGSVTVDAIGQDLSAVIAYGEYLKNDDDEAWYKVVDVSVVSGDTTITLGENYRGTTGTHTGTLNTAIEMRRAVSADGDLCSSPHVVASSDGVYVAYVNDTLGVPALDDVCPRVMLAYVSENGILEWRADIGYCHPDDDGYTLNTTKDQSVRLFPDTAEGVIVVFNTPTFVDESLNLTPATSTYAARFDMYGDSLYGPDAILLYRRRDTYASTVDNVANVWPDGEGGLWIAGREYYPDSGEWPRADNGWYTLVNRLTPEGVLDTTKWTKPFEWDSHEVGSLRGDGIWPGIWDRYNTHQIDARVVADGVGGAFVVALDPRKFDGGTVGTYLEGLDVWNPADVPSTAYNLWAQHLSSGGEQPEWESDDPYDNPFWYKIFPLPVGEVDYYYDWKTGEPVYENSAVDKVSHDAACHPWTRYDPIDGLQLWNPLVTVWADTSNGNLDIYSAEFGEVNDKATDEWGTGRITVCNTGADTLATGHRLFVLGTPRYGTYVVWTDSSGNLDVRATHFNYARMVRDGRVAEVDQGPDIFPPPPVVGLKAEKGPGSVTVSWTNPRTVPGGPKPLRDWAGTMVRRSLDGYPATPEDGELLYAGPLPVFVDTDVTTGVQVYYSVFTFDTELAEPNFSRPVQATALVDFSNVLDFTAQGRPGAIDLSWKNPVGGDYSGVVILRSDIDYPTENDLSEILKGNVVPGVEQITDSPFDATVTSTTDSTNIHSGVTYYYTAFSYDSAGDVNNTEELLWPNFSDGVSTTASSLVMVSSFTIASADQALNLTWSIDDTTGVREVVIVRNSEHSPVSASDGTVINGGLPFAVPPTIGVFTDSATDSGEGGIPLENGTLYYYSAFVVDDSGNYSAPYPRSGTPTLDPPTVLNGDADDGIVVLDWTNVDSTDLDGVIIVRRTSAPAAQSVTEVGALIVDQLSATSGQWQTYDDTSVLNSVDTYYYSIFSVSSNGSVSGPRVCADNPLDPEDTEDPPAIGLTGRAIDNDEASTIPDADVGFHIELNWVEPSATADLQGILIIRRTDRVPTLSDYQNITEGDGTLVIEPAQPNLYRDSGVVDGQAYYYSGWSFDDDGRYSLITSTPAIVAVANYPPALTLDVDPALIVNQPDAYSADIAWSATVSGTTNPELCTYILAYGPSAGLGQTVVIEDYASSSSFQWTGLPSGCTRYYLITATDSGGASVQLQGSFTLLGIISSADDTDGDGLEDAWEEDYWGVGGDLTTMDGSGDNDNDNLTELEEYRAGTDPNQADTDGDGIQDDIDPDPLSGGAAIPLDAPNDTIIDCGASDGSTLAIAGLLLALYALLGWRRSVTRG